MKESKKEALTKFHRSNIISASEKLFLEKGIENTTMDDIAKAAEYSKATLYVYFKNKEEIISSMTLIGMRMLLELIRKSVMENPDFDSLFYALCYSFVDFQKEHPFHFDNLLTEINVDIELKETPGIYREIYDVGEDINKEIYQIFLKGVEQDKIKKEIKLPQASFIFWASTFGVIRMSVQKSKYFSKCLGFSQKDFLQYSFELLYQSIRSN